MQSFAHFSLFCALNSSIMKKNIAIFASGSGSNAENLIRYFQKSDSVEVSLVLSNKSDAYVLERAYRLDRKSTRLNSSHTRPSRMPSSA